MLSEAEAPILESIRLGRTDILRTLLEEVRAEIRRREGDEDEAGEWEPLVRIMWAIFIVCGVRYFQPAISRPSSTSPDKRVGLYYTKLCR